MRQVEGARGAVVSEDGSIPESVQLAFRELSATQELNFQALSSGLLHRTYRVEAPSGSWILQKVSDVFAPEIHENIDAVTQHLEARGLATPRLLPTRDGELFFDAGKLGRWRLMTALEGVTYDRVTSSEQARSAGALVGRFHAALDDFDAPLAPMGLPFRDTAHYLEQLDRARARHSNHALIAEADRLSQAIRAGFERLGPAPRTAERVIHGDLKISNLLFEADSGRERGRATALIDLDTLMRAPLWSEWGDAWRSWCNRSGEDDEAAVFDLEVFQASIEGFQFGYGRALSQEERNSLLHATERLSLELAVRYTTDLLEEIYFAWDSGRFASAAEHNRLRAEGQLHLFEAAWASRSARADLLTSL